MARLQFLGAAKTVTGSKYVVEVRGRNYMIDCGLFQGLKELRLRNWEALPIAPRDIEAVVLTHAHVDHTGYLPRLVKDGFRGPVYATTGTAEISRIVLPDSGRLQEEDAKLANKNGYSKHKPALPLYTESDAKRALKLLKSIGYGEEVSLGLGLSFSFLSAGHILGSSFVNMRIQEKSSVSLLFSGDLGRYNVPILNDPTPVYEADYIVIESTYGNRLHDRTPAKELLADVINRTSSRGGRVIIPAFAVGRTQEILYYIRQLESERSIPVLPVIIDSPMAYYTTKHYVRAKADHDEEMRELIRRHINPLETASFHFGGKRGGGAAGLGPAIIISASGMATGGRVLNHLKVCLPDPNSTVVFVGFQAAGTRGRRLLDGDKEIKIHGEMVPVRAEIAYISNLSAHADYEEMLYWLSHFRRPPKCLFITHGEIEAAEALQKRVIEKFGWETLIPDYLYSYEL